MPKDATKSEKKEINNYNKLLKETRKTELPPVYEPFAVNCDLLFSLAGEKGLSEAEKAKIDSILHPGGEPIYLTAPYDAVYRFKPVEYADLIETIDFGGTGIRIPAVYLTKDATIEVRVKETTSETADVYTDWSLSEVKRGTEGDDTTFMAIFTSEEAKKHDWRPDAEITVIITPKGGSQAQPLSASFQSVSARQNWYDYFKVWEGQNNEWYDYLKEWDVKVSFERVG